MPTDEIDPTVTREFNKGTKWTLPRDPLVLDLDGDGVELTSSDAAVLFDHNKDNIRTGSQWVKPDDGILVRDLNGNGLIDSGRELFGDQTEVPVGFGNSLGTGGSGSGTGTLGIGLGGPQLATNGWQALAALDGNNDGVINSSDSVFAELKVWRDLNQDGISQADELQTLGQAGVSSISIAPSNQATGSYSTTAGTTRVARNIDFTTNNFYSEFTDNPAITASAAVLPQLQGAGFVRDMREAMSLGSATAQTLQQTITSFKAATTTQDRQALVDQVITDWANTSSLGDAKARNPLTPALLSSSGGSWYVGSPAQAIANFAQSQPALYAQLSALERFNGQPVIERYTRATNASYYDATTGTYKGYTYYTVSIEPQRLPFFQAAYDSLKASTYQSLYLQTEAKELLDQIELAIDDKGLRLDFAAVNGTLAQKIANNPSQAAVGLAEFISFTTDSLASSGWDGAAQLGDLLETATLSPAQTAAMQALRFQTGVLAGSQLNGGADNDILLGKAGNDVLVGNAGADVLIGGQGDDYLIGGQGNDQLVGGTGNDTLDGQWGNDTYFWGRGQGNDTINDTLADTNGQNTVVLRGLNPQDIAVSLLREDDYRAVRLTIANTGETLEFRNSGYSWWYGGGTAPVNFVFEDGTRWDMKDAVLRSVAAATAGDDVLIGTYFDDLPERLAGGAGDDLIIGREGADVMEGGSGNDMLWGNGYKSNYDDYGQPTPTRYVFAGGEEDSDTYVFGRGDGQDTIKDVDYGVNQDTLRFKSGIAPTDLSVAQRGQDLVVQIRGTTDQVTITGFFLTNYYWWQGTQIRPNAIEQFAFADGTTWGLREITDASWLGTDQDDTFYGDAQANLMAGGDGKDALYGAQGNDNLSGGAGDDVLDGGDGDDILDGGQGNDVLSAGKGSDIVRFGRGDGQDVLASDVNWYSYYSRYYLGAGVEAGGNNVVELKAGVTADDIKLERVNSNLVIRIKGSNDSLTVNGFADIFGIEAPTAAQFNLLEIRFADGTVWSPQQILANALVGDASDERFVGFTSDDTFDGQDGNDVVTDYGGTNTYLFGRGDGQDDVSTYGTSLLSFKPGVTAQDVQVRRVGDAAIFTIRDTGDSIGFNRAFEANRGDDGIDQFAGVRFADGSQWTLAQINQFATDSTEGDDDISDVLEQSNTTLSGGKGNDVLSGTRGATTYLFNLGDGQDTVIESYYSGADVVRFGAGITASDLVVTYKDDDLIIGISGTTDQITVKGGRGSYLGTFEAGGVTFTYNQIIGLIESEGVEALFGSDGDDTLTGTAKASNISGFGGNDTLTGNAGNDVIDGGDGNDVLSGGTGRDVLIGGAGSNVYRYQRGDQLDTIELTASASSSIELGMGISLADISVQSRYEYSYSLGYSVVSQLVIGFGGNDALLINAPPDGSLDSNFADSLTVSLANGTSLNFGDILALQDGGVVGSQYAYYNDQALVGSQADDAIYAYGSDANVNGRDNNDQIEVYAKRALVDGGNGNDQIHIEYGGGVVAGGVGNDRIDSYRSLTTYAFNLGGGKDRILANNSPDGTLSFGVGITANNVRAWIDASTGELVLAVGSGQADEVRSAWLNSDLKTASDVRALKTIQFIDVNGVATQYDLASALISSDLIGLSVTAGDFVFQNTPALGGAQSRPVLGGLAAIAYAQTSDLNGAAFIAANADAQNGNQIFGTRNDDYLYGEGGNDVVIGDRGADLIWGGTGDDYLDGQNGSDRIDGGEGDDVLYGGSGNDVLTGGGGNDASYGGRGNDEYVFSRADGHLYIEDSPEDGGYGGYGGYGGEGGDGDDEDEDDGGGGSGGYGGYGGYGGGSPAVNQLTFRGGITASDLSFSRVGDNLVINVAGATGDVITLAGFDENRTTGTRSVDRFVFQNGETLDLADVVITTTASADTSVQTGPIMGSSLKDELRGGLQNDVIQGGYGDDRLIGGTGADAYLIGDNDGEDTIIDSASESNIVVFTGNLSPDDLQLTVENGISTLTFGSSRIVLAGWNGLIPGESPITDFVFSNGSTLTIDQLFNHSRTIRGTPQDDVLTGTTQDDVIEGLGSNDLLLGDAGADTYVISSDSGQDTITDLSALGQENTLLFTDITNADDLVLSLNQQGNMVVRLPGGNTVTLTNFDRLAPTAGHSIEFFQFGYGGPILTYAELLERGFVIDGTASGDLLQGTAIHDLIRASSSDDVIEASTGSDALEGGIGNDTYNYRLGDGLVTIEDVADQTGGNILRFGPGITVESIERKLRFVENASDPTDASLNRFLIVFDENNQISVSGFDRQNPDANTHGIESFEFADGTVLTWNELLDKIFVVEGDTLDNVIEGTSRSDRLYGYEGADTLVAAGGDDVVTGGQGDDILEGGSGADNYVFNLGDGQDQLLDTSIGNTLSFGAGVVSTSVAVARESNGFRVSYGTLGDSVFIDSSDGINEPTGVIQNIELSDGTVLAFADLINRAPTEGAALINQDSRVGDAVNFALSTNAFTDADGDSLQWFAQLGTDQQLPSWLQFDGASRTFSGTPPVNSQGIYQIAVFARDASGAAASQVFNLNVVPRNSAPIANIDTVAAQEDAHVLASGNVLDNDTDTDAGDQLSVTTAGTFMGDYGTLVLAASGAYTYTLNNNALEVQQLRANQQVVDSFVYTSTDGQLSANSRLVVTVTGTNDAPVAFTDVAAVKEDVTLTVNGNLLANDKDPDVGDVLQVANTSVGTFQGTYGSLSLAADGSYTYTLSNGAANVQALSRNSAVTDTFAYTAQDDGEAPLRATSALTVTITGTNDGPQVVVDVAAVKEDGTLVTNGNVLTNDKDVDVGDVLTVAAPGSLVGTYGNLMLNANGDYSFALNNTAANVQSLRGGQQVTDTFAYSATDGLATSASGLVVTVTGTNDAPVAFVDTAAAKEDVTVLATGNVLANDKDQDIGDTLHLAASSVGTFLGAYGSLTLDADGRYTYALNNAAANVQGLGRNAVVTDTFAYTAQDDGNTALQATSALTVTITGTNDGPQAVVDVAAVKEDGAVLVTGNVLTNDKDVDIGDTLAVVAPGVLIGTYGNLTLNANGGYSYALNNAAANVQSLRDGQHVTDTFAYSANDGLATSASSLVVTVTGTNDGPQAFVDVAALKEDGTSIATGNLLANDKDLDVGDTLSVVAPGILIGTYGNLTLNANGGYSYALNNAAANVQSLRDGQQVTDTFAYSATDGLAVSFSSLVVTVTGTNDGPQAFVDLAAVKEDGTTIATGNVLTNDKDVDVGDTLTVANTGLLVGTYGKLTLNANGNYSYALNNAAANVQSLRSGQQVTDTFAYSSTDGLAISASSLVVTVTGTNDAPTVVADTAGVSEDGTTTASGNVLLNDLDIDGDLLAISNPGVMQGAYGQLTLQANGSYVYQLNNASNAVQSLRQDQRVQDVFNLQSTDGIASATTSLTVTVTGRNDATMPQADAASVQEDAILQATGNVLSNDSDADLGDVLRVSNAATYAGQYGSLLLRADGSYVYTLANNTAAVQSLALGQQVTESFGYTVSDGSTTIGPSAQANLVITISGSNDAPVLNLPIADISVRAKTNFTLDLPDNTFTDVDRNDVLGYTLALTNGQALPSWLNFNVNGLIISGTPPKELSSQSLELRLTAFDRAGSSTSDVFKIAVTSCVGLTLIGGCGNDRLVGTACDDTLDGRGGSDTMIGGDGDDVYYVDEVASQCESGDTVIEYLNQGYDKVFASGNYTLTQNVEALELTGCDDLSGTGNNLDNWIVGNSGYNTLDGKEGNDLITAGSGSDCVYGGTGNDVLEGLAGNDTLEGGDGIDALFGGLGNDTLRSGTGKGFLAGGKGNDALYAANAATVVAFNKGDGVDTLYTSGSEKITLSLGGGLKYEDIKISRSGNDLLMNFNSSATDRIKVANYYGSQLAQRPTFEVQMLTEPSSSYLPSGADVLKDNKIERFNGTQLIAEFDRAYQTTSSLRSGNQWAVMGSLLSAHLGGSNSAAIGGDLAYQFGQSAGLVGMGAVAANNALSDTNFASAAQALQTNTTVSVGSPRLVG